MAPFVFFSYLVLCCFVFTTSSARRKEEESLKAIYQESINALLSDDERQNMMVIEKYYFTREKGNSVWYAAQETALDLFNISLGIDDLKFIEKLILTVGSYYYQCIEMKLGKQRAQCFYHLAPALLDLERGTRWMFSKPVSLESKAKFGMIYNSAATLSGHLALIAKANFKHFDEPKLREDKIHGFRMVVENALRNLYRYDTSVIEWCVDAISPPIICEITQRFWKKFTGVCETRWLRSIDTGGKFSATLNENNKHSRSRIGGSNNYSGDDEELDSLEQYKRREEDIRISESAAKIGSFCSLPCKEYRAQVIDGAKDEILFERYVYATYTSRGDVLSEIAKHAQVARDEAARLVKNRVTRFANDTFALNYKVLARTLFLISQ